MWPDQVLNPGPLTFESGALPNALHGLAAPREVHTFKSFSPLKQTRKDVFLHKNGKKTWQSLHSH